MGGWLWKVVHNARIGSFSFLVRLFLEAMEGMGKKRWSLDRACLLRIRSLGYLLYTTHLVSKQYFSFLQTST